MAAVSPIVPCLVVLWTEGSFVRSAALFVSVLLGVEAAMVFIAGPLVRLVWAGCASTPNLEDRGSGTARFHFRWIDSHRVKVSTRARNTTISLESLFF